jgi:tRNA uridine 5-carboxymethylaminomethyl modification enzyme
VLGQAIEREYSLAELLRRPGVTYRALRELQGTDMPDCADDVVDQVEVSIKYQGYIDRQQLEVQRGLEFDQLPLPPQLDYRSVRGLSIEVQQKLTAHRPETLGQAARISGVTPAAISLLLVHLKRGIAAGSQAAFDATARFA